MQGRLSAVIDFGTPAVGDPAVDLLPAWLFLPAGARDVFRTALDVDDATWARGRGWALASSLPVPDDPARVRAALHQLDELVADLWMVRIGPARARSERDSPQPRQSTGEVPGSVSARPSWARSVIQRAGR
ncbi:phosphotransferase [Streptomyces sp. NBC_00353]|uniref:phosphotransferase n=1 Tax=Streptomyces sp. NBC_00353 TaxID=2975722 RepID=UPI003FA7C33C